MFRPPISKTRSNPRSGQLSLSYNVEEETYAKASQRGATNLMVEGSIEDEDDDCNEYEAPVDGGQELDLDKGTNLESPFLRSTVSDKPPVPGSGNVATTTATRRCTEMENHEPTERGWENM